MNHEVIPEHEAQDVEFAADEEIGSAGLPPVQIAVESFTTYRPILKPTAEAQAEFSEVDPLQISFDFESQNEAAVEPEAFVGELETSFEGRSVAVEEPEVSVAEPEALVMLEALAPQEMNSALVEEVQSDFEIEDEQLLAEIKAVPDKMAFKIGEAADLLGIKQYVLRYWESEFDALKPKKSNHNQRMYSRRDVEVALMIKKLLYRDRFSIEGARKALRALKKKVKNEKNWESALHKFEDSKAELENLCQKLQASRERWIKGTIL